MSIAVWITGRKVAPSPATIDLVMGKSLTVTVTATNDHDDELRAHGFDVEVKLFADKPTTVILRGTRRASST